MFEPTKSEETTLKPRALWIEDSARLELANLCGPVFFRGNCQLNLAEDVTTAVDMLHANPYDVVIVDVRLPPGSDKHWRNHYRRTGAGKVHSQLGLKLLRWLLGEDDSIYPSKPPAWIDASKFGVFTVESQHEVGPVLRELGVGVYQQKVADVPDTILDELISRVLGQAAASY